MNEHGSGWKLGNAGLGPALVRWFEVTVNGRPVRDWIEFGKAVGLPSNYEFKYWIPGRSTAIPPQEPRELFWVVPGPANDALRGTKAEVTIRICYCSIYDECWLASGGPNVPAYLPCPDPPATAFVAVRPSEGEALR